MKGVTQQYYGTTAEWENENPLLPKAVWAFEKTENGQTLVKIGDGEHPWHDLPYFDKNNIKGLPEAIADYPQILDAEAEARAAADSELQSSIDAEAEARAAADQNLQVQIELLLPEGLDNLPELFDGKADKVYVDELLSELQGVGAQVTELQEVSLVKAPIASPTFTGTPKVPSKTSAAANDGTLIATEAQVYIKANIASPVFTGTPKVPSKTNAATNDGTLIATEAQVYSADRRVTVDGNNINPGTNISDLTMQQGDEVSGAPGNDWYSFLTLRHNNGVGYFRQLALRFATNEIYTRNKNGGNLSGWDRLAFTSEVNTKEPKLYFGNSGTSWAFVFSSGYLIQGFVVAGSTSITATLPHPMANTNYLAVIGQGAASGTAGTFTNSSTINNKTTTTVQIATQSNTNVVNVIILGLGA